MSKEADEAPSSSSSSSSKAEGGCPICKMMRDGGCEQQFHVSGTWLLLSGLLCGVGGRGGVS